MPYSKCSKDILKKRGVGKLALNVKYVHMSKCCLVVWFYKGGFLLCDPSGDGSLYSLFWDPRTIKGFWFKPSGVHVKFMSALTNELNLGVSMTC